MMVAMMGYRTKYLIPVDGSVIKLENDTSMLEGGAEEDERLHLVVAAQTTRVFFIVHIKNARVI